MVVKENVIKLHYVFVSRIVSCMCRGAVPTYVKIVALY